MIIKRFRFPICQKLEKDNKIYEKKHLAFNF